MINYAMFIYIESESDSDCLKFGKIHVAINKTSKKCKS